MLDIETGEEFDEPNRRGELLLKSDCVMKGYLDEPEATAECLRGGWLHTGEHSS